MSNNSIAVSTPAPSYSGSQDYSAPTAAQTEALQKAAASTAQGLTTSSISTVNAPAGLSAASTLIMDGTTSTGGLNTTTLLATAQALPVLPDSTLDSSDEMQENCHSVADALEEGKPTTSSDSTSSTSDATTTSTSDTSSTSSTTSTSDSTSSTSDTSSTTSTTTTTTTDDTTTTSGTVSMTQIMDELAGLDISISNDAEAQNTALIDSINCMTSAAIKAGDDTIKAGNSLMQGAVASFIITACFTGVTMAGIGGATAEANETADSETLQHTNASVTESEKATAATDKALSTGSDEDIAAAKQANAQAKAINNNLPNSSAVKQQNQETITANENAIKAKEAENAAAKQKAATTTPQAPEGSAATATAGKIDDSNPEEGTAANPASDAVATESATETESATQLKAAKESLAKSNGLIDSKASFTASKQATAATERYMKNPTDENYQAACEAQSRAEGANAKLASSPLKEANNDTLMANQKAINQTKAAHTGPDGKPLQSGTVNKDSQTAASKSLAEAKASQAKAAQAMPKNVYVRNRLAASPTAMQTLSTAMQRNLIFTQVGEQMTNLVNTYFQAQSKIYEGEGQMEQADSSAFNEAITETNTSMQSLYTLAGDLRSSSSSVAQDMESMVSSTRA